MYGLLILALCIAALALLSGKLVLILGFVVAVATFAFPLGLILVAGIGIALTCRTAHRSVHWGQPE